jgi:putative oxidoreductase
LSAVLFHADFGDQMQTILFLKNLSIAGGFLMLTAFGPGALSLDAWWTRGRLSERGAIA